MCDRLSATNEAYRCTGIGSTDRLGRKAPDSGHGFYLEDDSAQLDALLLAVAARSPPLLKTLRVRRFGAVFNILK